MKSRKQWRKVFSGLMAVVTLLSTAFTPLTSYAADFSQGEPPFYEEVKDLLDADEVVTANDYEIEAGEAFDVSSDFTGLEIPDPQKVHVSFHDAKSAENAGFSTDSAGVYKTVYYVEPVNTEHPTYQISRNVTVKEPVAEEPETSGSESSEVSLEEEETQADDEEPASQEEEIAFSTGGEKTEDFTDGAEAQEGTYQVDIVKGDEFNVTLNHEDRRYQPGETVEFSVDMPQESLPAVETIKVEANKKGDTEDLLYSEVTYHEDTDTFTFQMPEDDIDLGVQTEETEGAAMGRAAGDPWDNATDIEANSYYYYSDGQLHPFDSVMGQGGNDSYKYIRYKVGGKTYTVYAYCMQHSKQSPPSGTVYKNMVELDEGGDDRYLRKAMFYGYGGPGWGGTFNGYNIQAIMKKYGCTTETRAMQHYLVDYLYDGERGFGGALSDTAKNMLREIKAALGKMPDPTTMELVPGLTTTADGKKTKTFTWKANEAFVITIHLENGVSLVNETTGKTGTGNVSVKGGEKFHLEATTANMGSLKGKYQITSNYPLNFHAMLLKLTNSQDIGFGYYTDTIDLDLSVDWPDEATIEIVKKDGATNALLAGAVYGVYSDQACTKLITKMPATDDKGASKVTITKTQDTVYLKEISVPNGYVLDSKAYGVKLVVGSVTKQEVKDKEQFGKLTVYKQGEVLTGAAANADGVTFQYTQKKQKGAVYNVYAGENISSAGGKLIYKKGALVKEGLATGEDGSVSLDKLYLGKYTIKEMKAPDNLVCTGESKDVTLSYGDPSAEVVMGSATFTNARQMASVSVVKKDNETKVSLPGGIYGLYAGDDIKVGENIIVKKDTLIEKATTGENGAARYKADLPIGHKYYIKELQAPANYFRNSEDTYTFDFQYTTDKEATVNFTHTFTNERVDATIKLVKKDAETGETPQGDATLEGAVYGLFAREDIQHPDGKTGVIYKAGTQVATLTTDAKGNASVQGLYLGKYYVKELTPPVGYVLDPEEHDIVCSYAGDQTKTVEQTSVSKEDVIKQPFQLIKAANDGKTDADLLKGAGFTAYLESSLAKKADGSYDFDAAKPIVLTADGGTEMFTDEKGYVCSIAIPYGTYVVRETTTPHNFHPVDDFKVVISENKPTEPQVWRVLLDEKFKAKLKIIKKDDETKRPVLIPNAEFRIFDIDHKKYVEQVTTYPTTVVHKSYFTDNDGYLILPNLLDCGRYRVEEVTAPDGYTINSEPVEILVDSDTAYQVDPISGDVLIEVNYENHPAKGRLTIRKLGETVKDFKEDFTYEESILSGAKFAIYAAEDIYTADNQKDENGKRLVEYAKDTLVKTVTTDETGQAVIENLPLGKYRVEEITAPSGYVLNAESKEIEFTYKDQDTPVIDGVTIFDNERQKVKITVEKQDSETKVAVKGAVFGLYNKLDTKSKDKVIVKADTLLQKATSGKDGQAVFTLDLPLGKYYVKELKAPDGYVSSDEVLEFDASYQGQDIPTIYLKAVKKNQPTIVEFTKSDVTTGVELNGAQLSVLDSKGNVIDSWTSVKDEPHVIKRLTAGENYTLRESFAPYGYLKTTDVTFSVKDAGEVQKVKMEDDVPKARLIINKKGEFLDSVSVLEQAKGLIAHLFHYVTGNLSDVTFEVYAAEAIKAADGVSPNYYAADELVETITTGKDGIAMADDLPVGKYYVKEKQTVHGYVLDEKPRYVDLSYRDQDTPVVTYEDGWQNIRQKVNVEVLKKEKDTDRVLKGGVFGLYTKEDIRSASGKVLLEAGSLIEEQVTGEDGKLSFMADLPIDTTYYVKELQAPDGFVTTGEEQEFTFSYQGEQKTEAVYSFTFEDEPTNVSFTKSDLTTGKELPGAKLCVRDEDGNIVDEWTSTEEAHVIKELIVGKTYTMVETKPADGYATAESVKFTVKNTAEMQKVEMKDDVTKVKISKTDITGSNEIPGAKLTIVGKDGKIVESWTSGDKPHYVEKLPVGTYTLKEEQAPKGYVVAESVTFKVKDTGEIQKVQMKDETAKGRLILEKIDKDSKKALAGVEFELRDADGKVVEKLKTDANGHATSSLLEIGEYEDGVYKKPVKYYLVETKALNGYDLDKTKYEVTFEYVDDKTPVVEVLKSLTNVKTPETPEKDTPSDKTPGTKATKSPKTGDNTNIWLPVLLLVVSAAGVITFVVIRRKRRRG